MDQPQLNRSISAKHTPKAPKEPDNDWFVTPGISQGHILAREGILDLQVRDIGKRHRLLACLLV